MTINQFYHVAIEVPDLEDAIKFYTEIINLEVAAIERLEEKNLRVAFLKGTGCQIEMLCYGDSYERELVSESISHFQHLSFRVDDIRMAMKTLEDRGITFDSEKPIPVFGGRVYYNTFRGPGGELLEIAEEVFPVEV